VNRLAKHWRIIVPAVVGLLVIVLLPSAVSDRFYVYSLTIGAIYLVSVLGLNLVLGAGVISIGTAAFLMIGAYTVALTQVHWHLNPVLATALAAVVCAAVGLVTAFPALRLGPFAVAVVTLMYADVVAGFTLRFSSFTGGPSGVAANALSLSSQGFWYLCGGVAFIVYLGHRNLLKSPLGRALMMGRRSEPVAASLGISTARFKLSTFTIYAALSGVAGGLYQMINGVVSVETFGIDISITLLLMAVLGGEATVVGPLLGAVVLTLIPLLLNQTVTHGGALKDVVYGVILLVVVLVVPGGLAELGSRVAALVRRRRGTAAPGETVLHAEAVQEAANAVDFQALRQVLAGAPEPAGLEVEGITKAIGGLRILRSASFRVEPGTVHGLIGPNGSGKTTLLNCISGLMKIDSGSVSIAGEQLSGVAAAHAKAGIGRTFQTALLAEGSSVRENLLVGADAHRKVPYVNYCLRLPNAVREARRTREEVDRWIAALGLTRLVETPVSALTPRERRLVEIGRALATRPRVILMDEPVAGLSGNEIDELERIIRLLRETGITVVLVEHHADLVMRLCDRVSVIDVGEIVITDVPATVSADTRVIAAYLGDELTDERAEVP
jgi:ABC-type branched-subunit amino acid transport system ATPase component/ABC-type branched-subunit amino acid transport system permease subunit